jgi:small subunit ribosomal protein S9
MADQNPPEEPREDAPEGAAPEETPAAEAPAADEPQAAADAPEADEPAAAAAEADEPAPAAAEADEPAPAAAEADEPAPAAAEADEPAPAAAEADEPAPAAAEADAPTADDVEEDDEEPAPREKPAIPGADLEVDIVLDDDRAREDVDPYAEHGEDDPEAEADDLDEDLTDQPIAQVTIDLGADARYRATGKRKSAVARVILRPGTGAYTINGRPLDAYFPRPTLQRTIRQPLEAVGFDDRMDVVARMHGGGVSSQAGALRHGISRALLEADPNLRGELKKRGFLTRDPRVKERKKAGLKKARKRPQFSKR